MLHKTIPCCKAIGKKKKGSLQKSSCKGMKKSRCASLLFYSGGQEHTLTHVEKAGHIWKPHTLIWSPQHPKNSPQNKEINQGWRWQVARLLRRIHIHLGLLMSTASALAVELWGTAGESEDAGDKQKDPSRGRQGSRSSSLSNSYRKEMQMEGKWWKQSTRIRRELMEGFQLLIAAEIQHWYNMELWSQPIIIMAASKRRWAQLSLVGHVKALWVEWDTKYIFMNKDIIPQRIGEFRPGRINSVFNSWVYCVKSQQGMKKKRLLCSRSQHSQLQHVPEVHRRTRATK